MAKTEDGDKGTLFCSFCGKSQHEVRKLIAGPTVFICDECVELCMDIIREEHKTSLSKGHDGVPTPRQATSRFPSRTSFSSARLGAARRYWPRRWRGCWMCRSPWPTPRR